VAELRALTVRQPWAHMIAHCGKNVENRGRQTRYRGLLAVHAGAASRWDRSGEQSPLVRQAWRECGHLPAHLDRGSPWINLGAVIAVAELAGCHHSDECGRCSAWSQPDGWHWELRDVRPLRAPVPCKGKLGLWRLPEYAEKGVREQLEDSRA